MMATVMLLKTIRLVLSQKMAMAMAMAMAIAIAIAIFRQSS